MYAFTINLIFSVIINKSRQIQHFLLFLSFFFLSYFLPQNLISRDQNNLEQVRLTFVFTYYLVSPHDSFMSWSALYFHTLQVEHCFCNINCRILVLYKYGKYPPYRDQVAIAFKHLQIICWNLHGNKLKKKMHRMENNGQKLQPMRSSPDSNICQLCVFGQVIQSL